MTDHDTTAHQRSVRAALPLALLALGARKGDDEVALRREVGLDPRATFTPDERLPRSVAVGLWRALILRHPSAHLSLELAESWRVDTLGLLGYLAANASTAGEALESFIAFQRLIDGEDYMAHAREGDALVITLQPEPQLQALRQPMEALMASGHAFMQGLVGAPLKATSVRFAHPATLDLGPYAAFFGVAPGFDAGVYELRYPWSLMAQPIPEADPQLASYLKQAARAELERWAPRRSLIERLAAVIRDRMGTGEALSLQGCARSLGMSERALQRELTEHDTSFREVSDSERRRVAELLLVDPQLNVSEVASALGYAEVASFSRAFKRWTGASPRTYRQELDAARDPL